MAYVTIDGNKYEELIELNEHTTGVGEGNSPGRVADLQSANDGRGVTDTEKLPRVHPWQLHLHRRCRTFDEAFGGPEDVPGPTSSHLTTAKPAKVVRPLRTLTSLFTPLVDLVARLGSPPPGRGSAEIGFGELRIIRIPICCEACGLWGNGPYQTRGPRRGCCCRSWRWLPAD